MRDAGHTGRIRQQSAWVRCLLGNEGNQIRLRSEVLRPGEALNASGGLDEFFKHSRPPRFVEVSAWRYRTPLIPWHSKPGNKPPHLSCLEVIQNRSDPRKA